jgi:glutamate racemase
MKKVLKIFEPKIAVLACNTATIAALSSLRGEFRRIPFVGTVPAVKPAALASNNGKVGVLGTARTIEEVRSLNLAAETCEIFGIAAPELVDFIELRFDDSTEEEKTEIARKYIDIFREANVDTLVLGCTHFLFLLEEFRREAKPFFEVFDSLAGITKRIEYLLDQDSGLLRAEKDLNPVHQLIVTSAAASGCAAASACAEASSFWENKARKIGFDFVLLNEP